MHGDDVNATFNGKKWIQNDANNRNDNDPHARAASRFDLNVIPGRQAHGLGRDGIIHYGSNSGYQAINLAYVLGATKIILLGYDMQATNGKVHFFGDHPKALSNGPNFKGIIPFFEKLAADLESEGIEVINCTRQTALPYFKRASLEAVLQSL